MPVKIKYIDDGLGVELIASGIVTGKDIIEANKEIYTQEKLHRFRYKIIDRTSCTDYQVTPSEIQVIANHDKEASIINPKMLVALISSTDLQYGMSRMYQAYTDDAGFTSKLFKDRKSAIDWIEEQLKDT